MPRKAPQQIKFQTVDKKQIKGKVRHTRTGQCTAKGKCFHGRAK